MPYGTITMNDGSEVLFEIDGPYIGQVSDEGVIQGLQQKIDSVLNLIKSVAESSSNSFQHIQKNAKPDEFEVSFGVKLTGEAGVVFAKAGSEGTFQIKLKWISE